MTRVRALQALLAALCSYAVALPLITLFTPPVWTQPVAIVVAVIALTGMAVRRVTASRVLPVLAQTLALAATVVLLHLRGTTRSGLLAWATVDQIAALLGQALRTVREYSAPAPATAGAVFAITLLVGLTAIAVDAIAVTRRSPAAAGLPLLAAYLASATNSGTGLALIWFMVPAVLWLALMGEDGLRRLRGWGGVALGTTGSVRDPVRRFAQRGRVMGVGALAAAAIAPVVVPQLPPTFLADGLGRADSGGGSGVTLESTVDIARSLGSRSSTPILRYTTTTTSPQPFRVEVLTGYADGQWVAGPLAFQDTQGLLPAPPPAVANGEKREVSVEENYVRSPQLALPPDVVLLTLGPNQWQVDENGVLRSTGQFDRYSAQYLEPTLSDDNFVTDTGSGPGGDFLDVDAVSIPAVKALTSQVVPSGATPLEAARAIQGTLRGAGWAYSLDLAPNDGSTDPLTHFLQTRQGYCVQYATAMVMMARSQGIPARMAVGYLPGTRSDDTWTVRAADAHAWPELWFSQLGWVRFEPTPSSRSGAAPFWTQTQSAETASVDPSASTAPSTAPAPSQRADIPTGPTADAASATNVGIGAWLQTYRWWLLGALLALAALLVVPVGAHVRVARARRRARDDAGRTEVEWQWLLWQLDDLGLRPPEGATPRDTAADLTSRSPLAGPTALAMDRVAATLEKARYAAPDGQPLDVRDDARTVLRAAARTRTRGQRMRAVVWPLAGREFLRECADGARFWGKRLTSRLRAH